jgi:hypothetical protein
MLKKNWVVMKITHRASKHGNIIQEVLFANGAGDLAYTYLDKSNDNYKRWERIVDLFDLGAGVIVTGLKPKSGGRAGKQLVTADSPVRIYHATEDISEVLAELVDLLDSKI